MKSRKRIIIAILFDLFVGVLGLIGTLAQTFGAGAEGNLSFHGLSLYRFFTTDGNVYATIVALLGIVFGILDLVKKQEKERNWLYGLLLASVVGETVILLVVPLVLSPMMGGFLWLYASFYLFNFHFFMPLLVLVRFLFFTKAPSAFKKKWAWVGGATIWVYGIAVLIPIFLKVWTKANGLIPYPFLYVYENPWYMTFFFIVLLLGGAIGLGYLFHFLNHAIGKKLHKE